MENIIYYMSIEDIKSRIEEISKYELILGKLGNELWAEKDKLRNQYKTITGNDI